MNLNKVTADLLHWYKKQARVLPWRESYNPYFVWISEVMLQQTTMKAVVPYFNRFVSAFPTVKDLAKADASKVLEQWAGLGYYSRAKNLHKASQLLKSSFPKTYIELLELPGFGPYTARAVSSIAFQEAVGVVDGNVIRVLSRLTDSPWEWWRPADRNKIQDLADQMAMTSKNSRDFNQSLMELGATVCTPQSPICNECPVRTHCQSLKNKTISLRPTKKAKSANSYWVWKPQVIIHKSKIYLAPQPHIPFLKRQFLPPGTIKKVSQKPKKFLFKHSITTHEIFVSPVRTQQPKILQKDSQWVEFKKLKSVNPSSMIQKILDHSQKGKI